MSTQHVVRPAVVEDLPALQQLARRTIDASYRSFLGDEGVDQFIGSGVSDDHIATQFHEGRVHCMQVGSEVVGLMSRPRRSTKRAAGWRRGA